MLAPGIGIGIGVIIGISGCWVRVGVAPLPVLRGAPR